MVLFYLVCVATLNFKELIQISGFLVHSEPPVLLELQDLTRSVFIAPVRYDLRFNGGIGTDPATYRSVPKLNPSSPNFYDPMRTHAITQTFQQETQNKENVKQSLCLIN